MPLNGESDSSDDSANMITGTDVHSIDLHEDAVLHIVITVQWYAILVVDRWIYLCILDGVVGANLVVLLPPR